MHADGNGRVEANAIKFPDYRLRRISSSCRAIASPAGRVPFSVFLRHFAPFRRWPHSEIIENLAFLKAIDVIVAGFMMNLNQADA